MTKRVSKKDLHKLTIPQLLVRYSVGQIIAAVNKHAVGARKPGQPPRHSGNILAVWANVEFRLKHGEARTKTEAFEKLASDLSQLTTDRPDGGTIRTWYYLAEKAFEREPEMRTLAQSVMEALELSRAPGVVQIPLSFSTRPR